MEGAVARVAQTAGRRAKKQALELSAAAAQRIRELLAKREKEYLKLSVKSRGCSGLSYTMTYAGAWRPPARCHLRSDSAFSDEPGKFDELVEGPLGVKVLVDNKALMHVVGTRMDFVSDRLRRARGVPLRQSCYSPSLRSEFIFENPNAKGACGCGESFTTG